MTLILTHIDRHGIVHASDSNLTAGDTAAGVGRKVFDVPYLTAGLSLAGTYAVDGTSMEVWMRGAITDYGTEAVQSVGGLAEYLCERLESEMTADEKESPSLIHLAGFVDAAASRHAEFYFIRNITGLDPNTGAYLGASEHFAANEQFWSRDCATPRKRQVLAEGAGYQLYINGFPSGRVAYLGLSQQLGAFFEDVWNNADWQFRRPQTIEEVALLLELQVHAIGTLFTVSDYAAPPIGGPVQILTLSA